MGEVLTGAADRFYLVVGCGIFLLLFFLLWLTFFIKMLFSGQESRLQNIYGTAEDKRKEKERNGTKLRLWISGIVLLALIVAYIFVL